MSVKEKKKSKGKIILLFIALVIILCCAIAIIITRPVDSGDDSVVIVNIQQGSGSSVIAGILKENDLIKSELAFKVEARIGNKSANFKAGTYAFSKSMSTGKIIDTIVSGKTAGKTFTVAEGQALYKLADQLDSEGIVDKKEFYKEVENGKFDYDFIKYLPDGPTRLEGFLYPDTYEVAVDASAHDVIDIMLKRFDNVIGKDYYKQAKEKNKTIYEIITAASVIQKEAGSVDEMKKVSSVIENRIKKDMPLQMDSIISYINKDDKIRATYSDIAVDSDYNPYTNKGLPPGPICSPGKDAIDAALSPDTTKYIYFVASSKMDGTNVFSETYKEFLKNKKAFDKAYEKYVKEHPGEE